MEEHLNSYNSPYKFNAKEFDAETGWYYYGARYYNPKWSIWLSVDPLAEKYLSWSPYNYTFQNPIRYVDPTGMAPEDWYENKETGELVWKNSQEETITDETGTWENVGEELLTFDGEKLTYYTQEELEDGNLKLHSRSFEAVSGRQLEDGIFDYSKEAQATPFSGPLPEGDYTVNPDKIQWWTDQDFITRTAAFLGKGTWPGGLFAWGTARTWLNPKEVNVINPATGKSVTRDNFSIHGGTSPGSAGCIDCTSNALPFFRMLEKSKEASIRLRVDY